MEAAAAEGKRDYDVAEIAAAIKIQSFMRGSLSRMRVNLMLGSLVEDMLNQRGEETTEDEMSDSRSHTSASFENVSLESADFLGDEIQEYLELKFEKEDPYASDDDESERIIRPSSRRDTWITHTPTGGKKVGKWSAAAMEVSESNRGHVKERAKLFDSARNLVVEDDVEGDDDDDARSVGDAVVAPNTPIFEKPDAKLGSSMNTFLSPSKFKSPESTSNRRATIAFSPEEKHTKAPRRGSAAIMDKVSMFQEFADHAKESQESKPPKRERRKKKHAEYDIDTCRTPTAGDLRKSFEAGSLYSAASKMPKLHPLESTESEGIQAKIAKLGIASTQSREHEVTPEEPRTQDRAVDFATQQYLMHDAARRIQALARGFLFRKKDHEATIRVLKWLQQHQDIEKVLTGDPENFSEEERAQAVGELTRTIHLLMPEDFMDGSDSMASDGSGSFKEDSFGEELSQDLIEDEKLLKSAGPSNLMGSFAEASEESSTVQIQSVKRRGNFRSRHALMQASATKIQALARGYLVRLSNYGAAVKALNWLKEYRLLGELEAKNKGKTHRDFNEDTFLEAIAAINELQEQLHRSATKIQTIGRGYTVRKFDMRNMMGVVEWIRQRKIELEEAEVPAPEELEKTWIFLENPYRWIREGHLEMADASVVPETANSSEQLDVDELVSTWEYLKHQDSESGRGEKPGEDEAKPGVQELAKFSKWLLESGHPYAPVGAASTENKDNEFLLSGPQNFNDMLQLWEFLRSNGVNVDVLRGGAMDGENTQGGYLIQYIDEDLSGVYKDPRPSIKALINYWSFTRKHEIATLLESRETEDFAPLPLPENELLDKSDELAQPEDNQKLDAPSSGTDIKEENPTLLPNKKRKSAANIDSMMSSLKWLKKKGVSLNRVKARTSIGSRISEAQNQEMIEADERLPISSSDMESTLLWLKEKGVSRPARIGDDMSSMLAWLDDKGFDPNSKNAPGSGPPTTTDMASALRWLHDMGSKAPNEIAAEPGTQTREVVESGDGNASSTKSQRNENPFKDILYSLSWLQKQGFDLDGAAEALQAIDNPAQQANESVETGESPSVDMMMAAFGATNNGDNEGIPAAENKTVSNNKQPANKELSHRDMKSAMEWLTKRGICKTPKRIAPAPQVTADIEGSLSIRQSLKLPKERSERESEGKRMESALSWLEQKGFDVRKQAIEKQDSAPTPEEVAATIALLEKQKGPGEEGRPSSLEMQEALKWVSLQKQTEQKKKKKSKTKGAKKENKKSRKSKQSKGKRSTEVSTDSMQYALAFLQKAGKAKPESRKSKGLEKTVDYLKQQVEIQRTASIRSNPIQPKGQDPEKKDSTKMQSVTGYEQNALEWLTRQGDHLEDAPYFKKLHKMLPGKEFQTHEQRAREIAKAMKWVKKQGLLGITKEEKTPETSPEDELPGTPPAPPVAVREKIKEKAGKREVSKSPKGSTAPTVKQMMKKKKKGKTKDGESSGKIKKTTAPTVKDMLAPRKSKKTSKGSKKSKKLVEPSPEEDFVLAVQWLNSKDENMEAAKYFKKLDSMVPKNPDHTTEERAKELVKALSWVRRTSEKKTEETEAKKATGSKKTTKKGTTPPRSPKKIISRDSSSKKKMKAKKADKEKINRTVIALKDLVKVQKTASKAENDTLSAKKKGKRASTAVDDSNNDKKMESTPERDYDNALSFIRTSEEGGNVLDVEDANYFKKLDNMLPKKEGQAAGDRAKEMVKMLAWLRKKGKV